MVQWQCLSFDQLDKQQLYALLKLRSDVFIVEQACPYPDIDGKDIQPGVLHLLGWQDNTLVASVRLLPAGLTFPSVSIGRVVTHKDYRGGGLGHQLMSEAIKHCQRLWPEQPIEISAQQYLEAFYKKHGFEPTSEPYLEDDILHVDMKRA